MPAVSVLNLCLPKLTGLTPDKVAKLISSVLKSPSGPTQRLISFSGIKYSDKFIFLVG